MKTNDKSRLRDIGELSFGRRQPRHKSGVLGVAAAAVVDQRQRVGSADIRQSPWRKICDLVITSSTGSRHSGTGWFITPRTLVTAGHCLFVFNRGAVEHGLVREINVMPARNGESNPAQLPFGSFRVRQDGLIVHPRWTQGDIDFDYGVIILPEEARDIGEQIGHFEYGHFNDPDLNGTQPTLSGYPDDRPDGTQWFEVNTIEQLTPRRVSYNIFTARGQSGSPVFFRNGETATACAVHNSGDESLNSGVRINPEVVAQLDQWRVD